MVNYVISFRYIGPNNNYITTKTIVPAYSYTDAQNNVKSIYGPSVNIITVDIMR